MANLNISPKFIPINEAKDELLDNIGKPAGYLGLGRKVYLVFDETNRQWGVERLNIFERAIRFLFGAYKETHKAVVQRNLLNSVDLTLNIEVLNRICGLWKVIVPMQDLPTQPSSGTSPHPVDHQRSDSLQPSDMPAVDSRTTSFSHDSSPITTPPALNTPSSGYADDLQFEPVARPSSAVTVSQEITSAEVRQGAINFLKRFALDVVNDVIYLDEEQRIEQVFLNNPALAQKINAMNETYKANIRLIHNTTADVAIVNGLTQGLRAPVAAKIGYVWAGSLLDGMNPPDEIHAIINLSNTCSLERPARDRYSSYHECAVDDRHTLTPEQKWAFKEAIKTAIREIQNQGEVLVHCIEGKNRTGIAVTVINAFFSGEDFDTEWANFYQARGQRLFAKPTPVFIQAGKEILQELRTEGV